MHQAGSGTWVLALFGTCRGRLAHQLACVGSNRPGFSSASSLQCGLQVLSLTLVFPAVFLCHSAFASLLPQAVGRALDISSCLSARLVCSSWCEGISASITSLCLTPGLIQTIGPAAVARALERMAQAEAVDIAVGPLRRKGPTSAEFVSMLGGMLQVQPGAMPAQPAAAAAGNAGNAPGDGPAPLPNGLLDFLAGVGPMPSTPGLDADAIIQVDQVRPYGQQDMLQLLQVLARHRPNQKLPTLYVYSESLSQRDRPGTLDMKGSWRKAYIEVSRGGQLKLQLRQKVW